MYIYICMCSLGIPSYCQEEEEEDEDSDSDGAGSGRPDNRGRHLPRNRPSIYQKFTAVREMERLIEEGKTSGVEKAVAQTFPHLFQGRHGTKSGLLGRWKTQCDDQRWREIPWDKMADKDRRSMKELPDWVRIPMGMPPRSLERFKAGKNVPACISQKLVEMVSKVTTGSEDGACQLTSGHLDKKQVKSEAERLLKVYQDAQSALADPGQSEEQEQGAENPPAKASVSTRWVNRFLKAWGWRGRTPNTYGAYLDYDDQRMIKSRQMFQFQRQLHNVRLDMTLNFDQVWKPSWVQPKKLLHRAFLGDGPSCMLMGKREKVMAHLNDLQQAAAKDWQVKKRRITGSAWCILYIYIHICVCVYVCKYIYIYIFVHIHT